MMAWLEKEVEAIIKLYESLSDEELTQENVDILNGLQREEINPTLDRYQRARQFYLNEAKTLGEEIKRLQARKKRCENSADSIKEKILFAVKNLGGSIRTTFFTFSRTGNKSIKVFNMESIPPEFIKTEKVVMRDALKKHILETGEIFDGVELEETESLSVR